jgi:hypothetical protein
LDNRINRIRMITSCCPMPAGKSDNSETANRSAPGRQAARQVSPDRDSRSGWNACACAEPGGERGTIQTPFLPATKQTGASTAT